MISNEIRLYKRPCKLYVNFSLFFFARNAALHVPLYKIFSRNISTYCVTQLAIRETSQNKVRKRKSVVGKLNLPSKSTVALCHRAYSRLARVNRKRMYLQSGAPVTFSTPGRSVRKGSKVEECLRAAPPSTYITRDILKKAYGIFRTSLPIYQLIHLRYAFNCISRGEVFNEAESRSFSQLISRKNG